MFLRKIKSRLKSKFETIDAFSIIHPLELADEFRFRLA